MTHDTEYLRWDGIMVGVNENESLNVSIIFNDFNIISFSHQFMPPQFGSERKYAKIYTL